MPRWKYKTSILDLDAMIPPDMVSCDETGYCTVDGIPGSIEALKDILDKEGESEWELVQCQSHAGKLLVVWKKEIKEAFAS